MLGGELLADMGELLIAQLLLSSMYSCRERFDSMTGVESRAINPKTHTSKDPCELNQSIDLS